MIINFEFLFLDYIVLIISLIFIIFGFWKGFINSILGLLTWVGSVFITIYSYEYLSSYINNLLLNIPLLSDFEQFTSILSIFISIPLIFLISLFLLKRVRKILSSDLDKQILGLILDKFFGALYGLLFTYIIASTLLYFTNNNDLKILNNFNMFLIENSNILNQISNYNDYFFDIYTNGGDES
tara:strand:- start:338 stop:886 length:549 start_codon:yes stop_codon:yes gene_type:complete